MTDTPCCSNQTPPSARDRLVTRLDRLPRGATAAVIVGLVVLGLVIGGPIGAVPAALGILGLVGILALTWSRITLTERALRIAVLVFLVGLTIIRTVPN